MCVEELIFKVKIVNNASSASDFSKSVFCIRAQGREAFTESQNHTEW